MADGTIEPASTSVSFQKAQARAKRPPAQHPKFTDMVTEAILAQTDRKGASLPAIKSYINATYPNVDPNMMKSNVRKALEKGLISGVIVRPKASEDLKGATGRFKVDKVKQAALSKPVKPKKAPPKSKTEKPKKTAAPKTISAAKKIKETLVVNSPQLKTPKKTSKSKTIKAARVRKAVEKVPKPKSPGNAKSPTAVKSTGKPKPKSKAKSPTKSTTKTTAKKSTAKAPTAKKTPTKAAAKPAKKKDTT